ncbi:hypothetical protein HY496_00400 [Candidatus Woesearchaeota archaeon]|nr:hypothetical protein [Candidatus Woesearchaeota archaeon]
MITLDEIRQYFWKLFGVLGVVLFWAGLWDGVGSLPYISNPFVSLVLGVILFTLSGVLFKDTSPLWTSPSTVHKILKDVHQHPFKHEFHIRYEDKLKGKDFLIGAQWFKKVEKGFLIFHDPQNKEVFIPLSRVKEILRGERTHWKKGATEEKAKKGAKIE